MAGKYSVILNLPRLQIRDFDSFLRDTELFKDLQLTFYSRSNILETEMKVVEEIDSIVFMITDELKNN